MKPHSAIVNVGRGGVLNEQALISALESGTIRLAVLDVFETEPLPRDSRFFDLPNVILTPHVAGLFRGYWHSAAKLFTSNLERYVAGDPLYNVVSREFGY